MTSQNGQKGPTKPPCPPCKGKKKILGLKCRVRKGKGMGA